MMVDFWGEPACDCACHKPWWGITPPPCHCFCHLATPQPAQASPMVAPDRDHFAVLELARKALTDALTEKQILRDEIADLKRENADLRKKMDAARECLR